MKGLLSNKKLLIGLVVVVVIIVALVAVTQLHLLDLLFPCGGEGQPLC